MTEKEKARHYLAEFIAGKGGPERVAAETGINRQTVRQLFQKRNGARQSTIDRLAEIYRQDFDQRKAGGYAAGPRTKLDPATDPTILIAEIERKDEQIDELREVVDELKEELREWKQAYRHITEHAMGVDREGAGKKLGSDNHITDYPLDVIVAARPRIGYEQVGLKSTA